MRTTQAIRGALVALGVVLVAWGIWLGWSTISGGNRIHVLVWFAAGVVIHDALVAPASVLLGRFALPHLPTTARWAARALLAWVAVVLVIALPVVRQDRRPANPTIEFGHPFVGVCAAIAGGIAVVAGIQIALAVRARRSARVR